MARSVWANKDGLHVSYGTEQGASHNRPGEVSTTSSVKQVIVPIVYNDLPGKDSDANNDGTLDSFSGMQPAIPAGAMLKSATLVVGTAFTTNSTGAIALNLGLYQKGGTAIDADGIDVALAAAALEAGDTVVCDGALVGKTIGANDGYIAATSDGAALKSGAGKLVIEFITKNA